MLALLSFAHGRDIRRLRDWAGSAPEREAERKDSTSAIAAQRAEELRALEEARTAEHEALESREIRRQRREEGLPEQTRAERVGDAFSGFGERFGRPLIVVAGFVVVVLIAAGVDLRGHLGRQQLERQGRHQRQGGEEAAAETGRNRSRGAERHLGPGAGRHLRREGRRKGLRTGPRHQLQRNLRNLGGDVQARPQAGSEDGRQTALDPQSDADERTKSRRSPNRRTSPWWSARTMPKSRSRRAFSPAAVVFALLVLATLAAFACGPAGQARPAAASTRPPSAVSGDAAFTPNGDCVHDRIRIRFRTTTSDTGNVQIVKPGGELVKTLAREAFLKRYRFHTYYWDGSQTRRRHRAARSLQAAGDADRRGPGPGHAGDDPPARRAAESRAPLRVGDRRRRRRLQGRRGLSGVLAGAGVLVAALASAAADPAAAEPLALGGDAGGAGPLPDPDPRRPVAHPADRRAPPKHRAAGGAARRRRGRGRRAGGDLPPLAGAAAAGDRRRPALPGAAPLAAATPPTCWCRSTW